VCACVSTHTHTHTHTHARTHRVCARAGLRTVCRLGACAVRSRLGSLLTGCRWVQVQGAAGTAGDADDHDAVSFTPASKTGKPAPVADMAVDKEEEEVLEFGSDEEDDDDEPASRAEPVVDPGTQQRHRREAAELVRLVKDLPLLSAAEREARFHEVERMMKDLVEGYGEAFTYFSVPADHWPTLDAREDAGEEIFAVSGSFESDISEMYGNIRETNADGTRKSPVWELFDTCATLKVAEKVVLMNASPSSDEHDNGKLAWAKFSAADFGRIARMQLTLLQVRAVAASQRGEFERTDRRGNARAAAGCDPPRLVRREG
jgi:hypothetical protein